MVLIRSFPNTRGHLGIMIAVPIGVHRILNLVAAIRSLLLMVMVKMLVRTKTKKKIREVESHYNKW